MKKALFLDRDGVLNRELGDYTWKLDEFEILADVPESLKTASDKGYMLIVISNQGGIARGIFKQEDTEALHSMLVNKLAKKGIQLDEVYYCPHHNLVGKCLCRKPDSLMLEKAMARFKIDPRKSFLVGDSQRDVDAATKAGIEGFLIQSNSSIKALVEQLP